MTFPLSTPAVSLRQLQYLVAVADLGGFGKAADACHVAQPSLSAQVALAEAQLGVQVFERSRQGVRVSTAGAAIIGQARRVLGATHELEELAGHLRDPFRGTFRLGIIPTVGPYILPKVAPALTQAYPNLTVVWREDRTPGIVQLIKQGDLDGGILALESDLEGLDHVKLGWDPFVLASAPGHPLGCSQKPVALGALDGAKVLLLDDGHCFRDQAWSLCAVHGAREMNYRATSLATLVQMVSSGSSVTLLPALSLPVENRNHQLCVRPFTPRGPGRTLVLAWRRGSALRTAFDAVANIIRTALAEHEHLSPQPRRAPTR